MLVIVVLAAAAACNAGASRRAPLAHTFESPSALVGTMLDAVERHDSQRLQQLAVSEEEFRAVIWPELPSSRPQVNLPVEYAWGTLYQNSRTSLAVTLREHGGRRFSLVRVDLGEVSTHYATFAVHREPTVVVRDESGREHRLDLFGALLERDGRWKIFSYVRD